MDRINFLLTEYENVSVSYSFLGATDWTTPNQRIAGKANFTIYIQKITLSVTTDNAATQTWQDDEGTPILAARSKASPGLGPITWDFGSEGFALTEGADLDHAMSAAGMAAAVTIQAYMRRTSPQEVGL